MTSPRRRDRFAPTLAQLFIRRDKPVLSVIVPFFNVEAYLSDCVTSILLQSLARIEVILVDDGSTDGSPTIADRLAAADRRVTVLTQKNNGPGGARNRGVTAAQGEYLTFVDSDDRLAPDALETMFRSAESNGADVVVGAIRRFSTTRSWVPEWSRTIHAVPARGVTLEDIPGLLRNNYPVGKLYGRRFWLDQHLAFRTHVIYEDQPLIAQMLSRARSINVLTDVVYDYRQREDRSSVSQRPEDLSDLLARADAWKRSCEELSREASASILSAWFDTVYSTHLHWYLDNDSIADPEFWHTLREAFVTLRRHEPASALSRLTAEKRTALSLLDADLQDDMIRFRNSHGYDLGVHACRLTPAGPDYDLPIAPSTRAILPSGITVTPSSSLALRQSLLRGGWKSDRNRTHLHVAGHAYIPTLDLADNSTVIAIHGHHATSGAVISFDVMPAEDQSLRPDRPDDFADYAKSAYEAGLDVTEIAGEGTWNLFVTVTTGPYTVTEPLRNLSARGGLGESGCRMLGEARRVRLVAGANRHVGLRLVIDAPRAIVEAVSLDQRELTVRFRSSGHDDVVALELAADGTSVSCLAQRIGRDRYEAVAHLPPLPATGGSPRPVVSWTVRARTTKNHHIALSWAEGRHDPSLTGTGSLRALGSAVGNLKLEEYPYGAIVVTGLNVTKPGQLGLTASVVLPQGCTVTGLKAGPFIADVAFGTPAGARPLRDLTAHLRLDGAARMAEGVNVVPLEAEVGCADGARLELPLLASQQVLETLPSEVPRSPVQVQRGKGRTLGLRLTREGN